MRDVREIPGQVFGELTDGRSPQSHDRGVQTCDMEHGVWLRLDGDPNAPQTTLQVVRVWADISADQLAEAKLYDFDYGKRLAGLSAGRSGTGTIANKSWQVENTIWLNIDHSSVGFSDPRSAENVIYGLELVHEMARRSFVMLTLDGFDKARYWSDEIGMP